MKKSFLLLMPLFLFSCEPSKEELKAQVRHVTIPIDNYGINNFTATYYTADGCEYVGRLQNSSSDFMAHSGQCKHCEKRQIQLMDSLIKVNLKQFFAINK